MTHILFITPYYPPEKAAPAVRISETARQLTKQGHTVTILTTVPNYPTGIVPQEYCGHRVQREWHDGIRVVRVWSYTSPNKGFARRILAQLSFGCLSPLLGWQSVGHPDVIIAESPPLFDAFAARLLSWGKRCPFIFTVSDIWPASAVQLGMLRNPVLIKLAEWLEWSTYTRASAVWALTEGIRTMLVERGLEEERVFTLTNGVDTAKFCPRDRAEARQELQWPDAFTVLYAGTHGLAHGLMTVLHAAERLRNYKNIRFVLVGDGATKADLMAYATKHDLDNVTFLDTQPHERMPLLLAGADVCLVPLRKVPLFEGALPSKMYEVMACARPILLGVDGEARRLVEQEAGAALYVEPENADAFAEAVLRLYDNPELTEKLGQRGRAFVERRFDRTHLTKTLEARLVTAQRT